MMNISLREAVSLEKNSFVEIENNNSMEERGIKKGRIK